MRRLVNISVIVAISLLLTAGSCAEVGGNFQYQPPLSRDDGLEVAHLATVGLDTTSIKKAVDRIRRGKYGEVHSMLIYKDAKLVLEEYFEGHRYQWDAPKHKGEYVKWTETTPHVLQSATKSITSICIGIAVEKGFIASVDESIFEYLPDHQQYKRDNKDYVTIEHLLTMTSGFQWDEWNAPLSSTDNDAIGIYFSGKDPVEFVLERPLVAVPGTKFTYSGGDMQLLAEILENASGMDINAFSEKYLFELLGIESFDWWLRFPSEEISTGGGLKMTPRDMLKVGILLLDSGVWNGEQILSKEWAGKSREPFGSNRGIKIPGEDLGEVGYGYTWWTKEYSDSLHMFCALGWGGQKIMVLPELNAVIVFTGANFTSRVKQNQMLTRYVLPAFK